VSNKLQITATTNSSKSKNIDILLEKPAIFKHFSTVIGTSVKKNQNQYLHRKAGMLLVAGSGLPLEVET
jgi:hypothetical protein